MKRIQKRPKSNAGRKVKFGNKGERKAIYIRVDQEDHKELTERCEAVVRDYYEQKKV